MRDIIKQWQILSLLPMCTTDAGLSIIILTMNAMSAAYEKCLLLRIMIISSVTRADVTNVMFNKLFQLFFRTYYFLLVILILELDIKSLIYQLFYFLQVINGQ